MVDQLSHRHIQGRIGLIWGNDIPRSRHHNAELDRVADDGGHDNDLTGRNLLVNLSQARGLQDGQRRFLCWG